MKQIKIYQLCLRIILFVTLITMTIGCSNGRFECIHTAGSKEEEFRKIEGFHSIKIYDNFDVDIVTDSSLTTSSGSPEMKISVRTLDYLLPNIESIIIDSVLILRNNNSCGWIRNPTERIHAKIQINGLIRGITLLGTSKITSCQKIYTKKLSIEHFSKSKSFLDISTTELNFFSKESGDIDIQGYSAIVVLTLLDLGTANTGNLTGDYVYVYHYCMRDCHVKPVKELITYTFNEGNTYYHNIPWKLSQKNLGGSGKMLFFQ